jgi:hypothetical protein
VVETATAEAKDSRTKTCQGLEDHSRDVVVSIVVKSQQFFQYSELSGQPWTLMVNCAVCFEGVEGVWEFLTCFASRWSSLSLTD